jgi:hypothetical protein
MSQCEYLKMDFPRFMNNLFWSGLQKAFGSTDSSSKNLFLEKRDNATILGKNASKCADAAAMLKSLQ